MSNRILVVEDDEKSRRLLVDVLGFHGYDVATAENGEHAIAVTASVMDQDRRRILAAGFDAYVGKPVNIRQLLYTLERLLEPALR